MNQVSDTSGDPKKEITKTVKHQNALDAWAFNIHITSSHEDASIPSKLTFANK